MTLLTRKEFLLKSAVIIKCLSPETYQKIRHLPQLNNWNLCQNKSYMLYSLLSDTLLALFQSKEH